MIATVPLAVYVIIGVSGAIAVGAALLAGVSYNASREAWDTAGKLARTEVELRVNEVPVYSFRVGELLLDADMGRPHDRPPVIFNGVPVELLLAGRRVL